MRKGITKSSLTKKSQVTIPKMVRDAIGLKPGDRVEFLIDEEKGRKSVYLVPREAKLLANFGKVKPRQKPEDFRKLREAFEQGVADEVLKEMKQE